MKRLMAIRDVMTRTPVVVNPNAIVYDAVKLMLKGKVGSLVIQENGLLKGLITEKDIIEKIVLRNLNPKKTKVNNIMTRVLVTVDQSADIFEAIKLMSKYNIRRLPVVDKENKLLGLVTVNDILRVQPQLFELVLDKSRLFSSRKEYIDSKCAKCGVYGLVRDVDGRFLCQLCERNESVINYLK